MLHIVTLAVLVLLLLAILHYTVVTSRQGWMSAESVAVASMLIMTAGLIYYGEADDQWFVVFSMLCYAACILGMILVALFIRPVDRRARAVPVELLKPTRVMTFFLVASALVTMLYFWAAGAVPLVAGLQNLAGLGDNNVRDLRLETYKGEGYLAPGYVNQVKNVILPSLATVAVVSLWITKRSGPRILAGMLAVGTLIALFGTGQRTFGIVFGATIVGAYSMIAGGIGRATVIRAGIAILLVFTLSTAALGRSAAQAEQVTGLTATLGVYLEEVLERFFYGQQVAAIYAEQVVGDWDIAPFSDWWSTLAGYLPGQASGLSIAGEVGRVFYGSDQTTVPPSAVTSTRINISNLGAVIFFFFWGLLLALVSRALLRPNGGSPLYFIGSAGLMIVLGAWVSDAPVTLLQTGAAAFALLAFVGRRQYRTYMSGKRLGVPSGRPSPPSVSPSDAPSRSSAGLEVATEQRR